MKSGATFPGGKEVEIPVTLDSGIPVYQRAGSIIPKKLRHRRSSTQMQNDPYTLVCFYFYSASLSFLHTKKIPALKIIFLKCCTRRNTGTCSVCFWSQNGHRSSTFRNWHVINEGGRAFLFERHLFNRHKLWASRTFKIFF